MRRLTIALRRMLFRHIVRSLETRLHDQSLAIAMTRDPLARRVMEASRDLTARELARARADYCALLPPGERLTFEVA